MSRASSRPWGKGEGLIASRRITGEVHIGTAGWGNPPAERGRRPASHSHLQHYTRLFNAVEINSSFYRSHQRTTYVRWRDSTPAGFSFSVKLPRSVTHECALRKYRVELGQFAAEVSGLGAKLGVILVQLPPSLALDARAAAGFFRSLSGACNARIACEPRHPSWFCEGAETLLRRHGVARVAADPPKGPGAQLPGGAKELAYYRLHGSPRLYYSAYNAGFLNQLAAEVKGSRKDAKDTWCVFDNTARYEAWGNARQLSRLLGAATGVGSAREAS